MTALALRMNERLQHQCTGFIQAEAEAFAEEIQERETAEESKSRASSASEQDDEDEDETPVKATYKYKSKEKNKMANGNANHNLPKRDVAADLASEYAFISVVTYFLRGIIPGAIDARHASVLLAYHGRLGTQFDHCLSTIINVLREEGLYKKNGAIVEQVVCEAIRQVRLPQFFFWVIRSRLVSVLSLLPCSWMARRILFPPLSDSRRRLRQSS